MRRRVAKGTRGTYGEAMGKRNARELTCCFEEGVGEGGGMHDPVLLRGEDERTGGRRGEKGVKWTVEEDCWVWMRGADCIRRQNMKNNNNKNKNKKRGEKGGGK
jgi:hypothetical protein